MSGASRLHLPVYFFAAVAFNQRVVVPGLEFEPEAGWVTKKAAEPHGGVGGYPTAAVRYVRDPT